MGEEGAVEEGTAVVIQHIQADVEDRVETGALQINDDWPGLFVRGDEAIYLAGIIRRIEDELGDKPTWRMDIARLAKVAEMVEEEVNVHGG